MRHRVPLETRQARSRRGELQVIGNKGERAEPARSKGSPNKVGGALGAGESGEWLLWGSLAAPSRQYGSDHGPR